MPTNNSFNNKSQELTVDPGASGDSFVQFDINGTGEFRIGVDDGAGDSFKISQGSAIGTNDTFVMTAAGERTMPLQPAFYAFADANLNNVTGDGTTYNPVIYSSERFDQGSDYSTSTGVFTAPVSGRYIVGVGLYCTGLTSSHIDCFYRLNTSNDNFYISQINPWALNSATSYDLTGSVLANMDAADTADVSFQINGGALVVDLFGRAISGNEPGTFFWGYLAV